MGPGGVGKGASTGWVAASHSRVTWVPFVYDTRGAAGKAGGPTLSPIHRRGLQDPVRHTTGHLIPCPHPGQVRPNRQPGNGANDSGRGQRHGKGHRDLNITSLPLAPWSQTGMECAVRPIAGRSAKRARGQASQNRTHMEWWRGVILT